MKAGRLFSVGFVCVLLATASAAAGATPLAGPCAPGTAYDPACDANQDGQITITDIQLTAGHWNQTGTWTGDNQHNHLGQTWTGSNNPLKLDGAYGAPDYAALVLSNSSGYGLRIPSTPNYSSILISSAGWDGVAVVSAADAGVYVGSAANDGIFVCRTGNASGCSETSYHNGVEIANAEHDGMYVRVAGRNGAYVYSAGVDGINITGSQYAGNFSGDINVTGNCIGCLQANFAVNAGDRALQPGDVVSVQSVTSTDFDTGPILWQVTQTQPDQTVVGVVAGRAELVSQKEHRPNETGKRLVPRDGAAQPGEYVTVVYSGPIQVRVASGAGAITPGTRLSAAADGTVRPLGTLKVQLADGSGSVDMLETAPVIGVALEAPKDGMVWVLVNPQ